MSQYTKIENVGILGAGTMGAALAQKFAQEGLVVVLLDRENSFLDRGIEHIRNTLGEGVERKIFSEEQKNEILGRIRPTTDHNQLKDCQILIEAVFEDLSVKTELFRKIGEVVSDDAILASNTSSFSPHGKRSADQ